MQRFNWLLFLPFVISCSSCRSYNYDSELEDDVDCVVGEWLSWTACSTSCGSGGKQIRIRGIKVRSAGRGLPCPELKQQRRCNVNVRCTRSSSSASSAVSPYESEETNPATVATPCTDKSDGHYATGLCASEYFSCVAGWYIGQRCPGALVYDPDTQRCDMPFNTEGCTGTSKTTTTVSTMETLTMSTAPMFDCSERPNGFYANPYAEKSCDHIYFACTNGFTAVQRCPASLYFDEDAQSCDLYAYIPICSGQLRKKSWGLKTGDEAPMLPEEGPFDCKNLSSGNYANPNSDPAFCSSTYYTCVDDIPIRRVCPEALYFDRKKNFCNFKSRVLDCSVPQQKTAFSCTNKKDGVYADPGNSCGSVYYFCSNQTTVVHQCQNGYVFDSKSSSCKIKTEVYSCQPAFPVMTANVSTTISSVPTSNQTTATSTCSTCTVCTGGSCSGSTAAPIAVTTISTSSVQSTATSTVSNASTIEPTFSSVPTTPSYSFTTLSSSATESMNSTPSGLVSGTSTSTTATSGITGTSVITTNMTTPELSTIGTVTTTTLSSTSVATTFSTSTTSTGTTETSSTSSLTVAPTTTSTTESSLSTSNVVGTQTISSRSSFTVGSPTANGYVPYVLNKQRNFPIDCAKMGDGLHADPANACSKTFYYCAKGVGIRVVCPDDMFYDAEKKTCAEFEKIAACVPRTDQSSNDISSRFLTAATMCSSLPDGRYANPLTPCSNLYIICTAGSPSIAVCPKGLFYSHDRRRCDERSRVAACISSGNRARLDCNELNDGVYTDPDALSRNQFRICSTGKEYEQTCPKEMKFDNISKSCLNSEGTALTTKSCYGISNGNYAVSFRPCSAVYYKCEDDGFALLEMCPDGTVFNGFRELCQSPNSVDACKLRLKRATKYSNAEFELKRRSKRNLCDGRKRMAFGKHVCSPIYFECMQGRMVPVSCGHNERYNSRTEQCENPEFIHECQKANGFF